MFTTIRTELEIVCEHCDVSIASIIESHEFPFLVLKRRPDDHPILLSLERLNLVINSYLRNKNISLSRENYMDRWGDDHEPLVSVYVDDSVYVNGIEEKGTLYLLCSLVFRKECNVLFNEEIAEYFYEKIKLFIDEYMIKENLDEPK